MGIHPWEGRGGAEMRESEPGLGSRVPGRECMDPCPQLLDNVHGGPIG